MDLATGPKQIIPGPGFCLTILAALAFLGAPARAQPWPASGPVNGPQAQALISQLGEQLLVVDVRTPEEFARGHIPNALSIPVAEMETKFREIPADKPILLLCRSGRRAAAAFNLLVKMRPELIFSGVWRLEAVTSYLPDGGYVFQKN